MSYATVLIDPPWRFKSPGWLGGAERHYATLDGVDLFNMPVDQVAAKDAHLWLWATDEHLHLAHELIKAWNFTKRGTWPWLKLSRKGYDKPQDEGQWVWYRGKFHRLQYGNGYYGRSVCEFLLLATRGRTQVTDARHGRKILLTVDHVVGTEDDIIVDDEYLREPIVSPVRAHSEKPPESYDLVRRYSPGPMLEMFARQDNDGFAAWGNQAPNHVHVPIVDAWAYTIALREAAKLDHHPGVADSGNGARLPSG